MQTSPDAVTRCEVMSHEGPSHCLCSDLLACDWQPGSSKPQPHLGGVGNVGSSQAGAENADGILLHFHGRGGTWSDQPKAPILPILEEMARVANWDVLRINRHALADTEQSDDDLLRFVPDRVARARQDGYKKIVVGGGSGGGWLALLAAAELMGRLAQQPALHNIIATHPYFSNNSVTSALLALRLPPVSDIHQLLAIPTTPDEEPDGDLHPARKPVKCRGPNSRCSLGLRIRGNGVFRDPENPPFRLSMPCYVSRYGRRPTGEDT